MKRIFLFIIIAFCAVSDLKSQTFGTLQSVSNFVTDSIKKRPDKINANTLNKAYQGVIGFVPDIVQDTASVTSPKHGYSRFQRKDSSAYVFDTIGYRRWRKVVPPGAGGYSDEQAQDALGAMVSSEFTYNDAGNSLAINSCTIYKNYRHKRS
jgi:hypothetical protein